MSAPRAATPGPGGGARKTELELELGSSTQTSHRLLAYSDALLSIIATVMILPVAHTKIHPDQVPSLLFFGCLSSLWKCM
uniref:Endosomal/lysosomal potassium channel TMEM175 n=1 Tax=Pavo cristatus TaxID=9049 RepID=A0A8C9FZ69_PAVCR